MVCKTLKNYINGKKGWQKANGEMEKRVTKNLDTGG